VDIDSVDGLVAGPLDVQADSLVIYGSPGTHYVTHHWRFRTPNLLPLVVGCLRGLRALHIGHGVSLPDVHAPDITHAFDGIVVLAIERLPTCVHTHAVEPVFPTPRFRT